MVITGDRIRLRDRCEADLEDYRRWFAPGKAWKAYDAPWEAVPVLDDARLAAWRERLAEPLPEKRMRFEIETVDGRHIGWVSSYWVDERTDWRECGIIVADEELWGRGLGREALTLWIDYLMAEHDLPRIGIGTWGGNQRMIRLAARAGMREEACVAGAREVEGERHDAVRWGLTRAEWERFRAPREDGLRTYKPADWESTLELIRQLYQHHRALQRAGEFTLQDARETLFEWRRPRTSVIWLWQEEGEVVSLIHARRADVTFLEEFVVAEGHRSQGVGERCLSALEDHLRGAGERDVFLSMVWPGNLRAIDFYRRVGYDLINTFELRKGLHEDRRGRPADFLGRRFHLGQSVP